MTPAIATLLKFAEPVLDMPAVRYWLTKIPVLRRAYKPGWHRTHPVDRFYGIATSGYVAAEKLHADRSRTASSNPYAGSEPSVMRWAFGQLDGLEGYGFVDLGCGKGRALVVATEFAFRSVVGVDLSPGLVQIARRNAAVVAGRYPDRTRIEVVEGDAVSFAWPAGDLVIFIYHAFGADVVGRLAEQLAVHDGHLFVVYNNPVFGDVFDASPAFTRWCADIVAYDAEDVGYGPDAEDAVVIWQSVRGATRPARANASRAIVVTKALWQARLAPT